MSDWRFRTMMDAAALPLVTALTVIAVYWQTLFISFVQDDWMFLRMAQTHGWIDGLRDLFQPWDRLTYRPLAEGYMFLSYKVFGAEALPFHIVALSLHIVTALLVASIIGRLLSNRLAGYLTGIVYAAAVAVHLDPLIWAAGIQDVGAAFFFLLSMWLFMRGRPLISSTVFLVGLLFKESIIVLPLILFLYCWLGRPGEADDAPKGNCYRRLLPFLPVAAAAIIIKMLGDSVTGLPDTHPYAIDLFGIHVVENTVTLFAWMFHAIFPVFLAVEDYPGGLLLPGAVLVVMVILLLVISLRSERSEARVIYFLLLWLIVGLVPVLFLPNHIYRNYTVLSLPVFIALAFMMLNRLVEAVRPGGGAARKAMIAVACVSVAASVVQGNRVPSEGLEQRTIHSGTNALVVRAAIADAIRRGLLEQLPDPPDGASIVIGGTDLWAIEMSDGPRFWYDDGSINVFSLSGLSYRDGRPYFAVCDDCTQANGDGTDDGIFVDPSTMYIFELNGLELQRVESPE